MMIELILIILGLVHFLDALFEKWDIWDSLAKYGSQHRSKWVFALMQCRFCLRFWISSIILVGFMPFEPFSWRLVMVPLIVGGLTHLIERK